MTVCTDPAQSAAGAGSSDARGSTDRHLEEHQDPVSGREELRQDSVEQLELAGHAIERRVVRARRIDGPLDRLETERMVADLRVWSPVGQISSPGAEYS